jgi:quinohemoprotein ethanol dehydrogenase
MFKLKILLPAAAIATLLLIWFNRNLNVDWPVSEGDKNETYFSQLTNINAKNVSQLGFAWAYNMNTFRGQEATPIVVSGIMYTSGIWGWVYAVNAKTGKEIWKYDPQVPGQFARNPCCDIVNRGLSFDQGKVFVASIDGRVHALDAKTGKKIWETDSNIDHKESYSSTGSVQLTKNAVVIGTSGADMNIGGVRGYVSAFDLESGKLKWRFFTVPPARGQPFEHPELEIAEKTWSPVRGPEFKGGGTVWDGINYDPETNLVIFGTSNGSPYDLRQLGPGEFDNLYVASIIAVDADTGRMVWHYQETPGDHWDYTAVQKMIFANLNIGGKNRKVVMQASKNGFFYILDRTTGELLSAKNYSYVNWATHIDMKTGRPVLTKQSDWYSGPKNVYPSWSGAHSWQPMSFNSKTGLVYIPTIDTSNVWVDLPGNGGRLKFVNSFFTAVGIFPDDAYDPASLKSLFGPLPDLKTLQAERPGQKLVREVLKAWDPVNEKSVWEHETSVGMRGYDGGVMSTSDLVFQGRGSGELWIYKASSGELIKKIQTGSHIMAAPMTYVVDGEQYVAVQVGYGGTAMGVGPIPASSAAFKYQNMNRIIAFKLGGGEVPKPELRPDLPFPEPPPNIASKVIIAKGEIKFMEQCSRCHTFGPNITPDLRKIGKGMHDNFKKIVLGGLMAPLGMASFSDVLTESDVQAIQAYVIDASWSAYNAQK